MDVTDVKLTQLTRNVHELAANASEMLATQELQYKQLLKSREAAAALKLAPTGRQGRRKKVAVVAWDLGHNPVGRAYVIYQLLQRDWDVELVGPMWSRYGQSLWAPLRGAGLRMRSFRCNTIDDFLPQAELLAATRTYDLVYVCKPRLPSLFLGALLKDGSDCPMVVDVDDFELSFFKDENDLSLEGIQPLARQALEEPYEELGTRYAQTLIGEAEAVSVSNIALQQRFDGHMVRHARSETEFRNSHERRQAARDRLGIGEDEFALIFIGTPRAHKGVLDVARALHEINDPTLVFHVVGAVSDSELAANLAAQTQARIFFHPNCAFSELPDLLAGADLVPLIQDIDHSISQYQIPAKISDALSLGVPVLATHTPPLVDLIAAGSVMGTTVETLAESIAEVRRSIALRQERGARERRRFVGEFGESVNRERMQLAIDEAIERHAAGAEDREDSLSEPLKAMVSLFRETYAHRRRVALGRDGVESPGAARGIKHSAESRLNRLSSIAPAFLQRRSSNYNIAFFWKQNDSGLYGRRSDMIAQHLLASGRVDQLLHFDAPVSAPTIDQHFENMPQTSGGQQGLILQSIVDRQLGLKDTPQMRCRTYLGSGRPSRARFLGTPVEKKDSYVRFVRDELDAAGLKPSNTIAWFCPVIWDARELLDKVGFTGVVADVIDDQRGWEGSKETRERLEKNYRHTLGAADLVLANCDTLAVAMNEFADAVDVVPNGAERFLEQADQQRPEGLSHIEGPIAGYVGNLRDRIDWLLLQEVVQAMPDVAFVFYGPSNDNPNADSLAKFPNVHIQGVLPYDDLGSHLKAFDVGLVPHLNNRLTERMNPLKVYNYFAAGLPIVSTDVKNLEELGSSLETAVDAPAFISAIRRAIDNRPDTTSVEWQGNMDRIAWDTRVDSILELMDEKFRKRRLRSA